MSGKHRIEFALNKSTSRKRDKPLRFSGLLGIVTLGKETVSVAGRNGFVWVRLRNSSNEVIQAHNKSVAPVYGLPVLVERDEDSPNRYTIVGRDIGRYGDWGSNSAYLPNHGAQHSFNPNAVGGDIVWVYSKQFEPFLVTPSGSAGAMSANFEQHVYYWGGSFHLAGGTGTPDLTVAKPADNQARMLLIYLDPDTGNLGIVTGSSFSATITGTAQVLPYVPGLVSNDDIPLAGVRLVSGTSIISWDNLYDLRTYFAAAGGAYGGTDAPNTAQYVTMALNAGLSQERVLTAGADITVTDGGAGGNVTVAVATGTFSRDGHTHAGLGGNLTFYDDAVFKATGTVVSFGNNLSVSVTGTTVFVDATAGGGGGGSGVVVHDSGVYKVTGTVIDFADNLTVVVTGSTAYVAGSASASKQWMRYYSDSTVASTSAYVTKGFVLQPTHQSVILHGIGMIGANNNGTIYKIRLYRLSGTTQDGAALEESGNISAYSDPNAEYKLYTYKFASPVTLVTGTRYVVAMSNMAAGATALSAGTTAMPADMLTGFIQDYHARTTGSSPNDQWVWDIGSSSTAFAGALLIEI